MKSSEAISCIAARKAVILCHAFDPANLRPLIDARVPIIEVERQFLDGHHLDIDPLPGLLAALQLLKRHGHRRITFLGGRTSAGRPKPLHNVETGRLEAFQKAVLDIGLDPSQACGAIVDYDGKDMTGRLQGQVWADGILRSPQRPTAIITGSDVLAAGVLQAAYSIGLHVPEDLSIIGYDDSLARFLSPPLTTVAQPYDDIGRVAMEMVLETKETTSTLRRKLPTCLIERSGVGPARA